MSETGGSSAVARSGSEPAWRQPVLRGAAGHAAGHDGRRHATRDARFDIGHAAGRGAAWRGCCGRLAVLSLLALGGCWLTMAPALQPAHAGEARASFQVGIRIGPATASDLSARTADATRTVARVDTVAASSAADGNASVTTTPATRASTARVRTALPRVGGGWCVRVTLSDGRWRWQCD